MWNWGSLYEALNDRHINAADRVVACLRGGTACRYAIQSTGSGSSGTYTRVLQVSSSSTIRNASCIISCPVPFSTLQYANNRESGLDLTSLCVVNGCTRRYVSSPALSQTYDTHTRTHFIHLLQRVAERP